MDEKKLADELRSAWEAEFKPLHEQMESEAKKTGEAFAESKQSMDRIQDRMDSIEAAQQKTALATEQKAGELSPERKATLQWVRRDWGGMTEEQKALVIRDETSAGVLAPPEFIADVVKGVILFSPVRGLATVQQTSRTSIQFPKRTGNFAAVWTGEAATRTETTGRTYGLDEIPNHEMYARVVLSNWAIEDPVVDLEPIIRDDMAFQFGKLEGAGFINGTSVGQPEGLLTNADVIASPILNGGATFANADGLIKQTTTLKPAYWSNARFLLHQQTLGAIRLLKDSNLNYLWQPAADGVHGLATGIPASIAGYPYTVAPDMPTAASNALTVAFGDFKRAYWIVDHVSLQYLRDPYTQAGTGGVVLHARKRVGGQVVLPEAINVLKMA